METKRLGFLDFGEIEPEEDVRDATIDLIEYARCIEDAGFRRLWLGEHHSHRSMWASSTLPVAMIAEHTKTLKVGAAGVLLLAANPLDVASSFAFLATRFPDRIELGLAKGLPTLRQNRAALVSMGGDKAALEREYSERARFLRSTFEQPQRPDAPRALPLLHERPHIWILGSSGTSLRLARELGTRYAHALFFSHSARDIVLQEDDIVAVAGTCAPTREEAIARLANHDGAFIRPSVVGSPRECVAALSLIAANHGVEEVVFVDCGDRRHRNDCVRLLARELQHKTL